jgi:ABC-type Fe3+-siderophore transport system permease subunit
MSDKHILIRDSEAWDAIELFLASAVAAILVIRGYLAVSGYPKIGMGGLHIAHMLWGGMFMLAALLLLLIYWNPSMRRFAAFLAGIGFGTFIDEVGKFITHDNDYFYKPAPALIYIIFIFLFLMVRSILGGRPQCEEESAFNAELRRHLPEAETAFGTKVEIYFRFRRRLNTTYRRIVLNRWFSRVLTVGFVVVGLSGFITVITNIIERNSADISISFIQMIASTGSMICIWLGIWRLRTSRLGAYTWFKRSVLVNIYLTQIFVFYHSQFNALGGLLVNALVYVALCYMISREEGPVRIVTNDPAGRYR